MGEKSMKAPKEIRHKLGARGENIAVKYLKRHNYIIITRNWKIKAGELDIVAFKDDKLFFVEVKTRTWRPDIDQFRHLSLRQAKRNRMAGKCYWRFLEETPESAHFDLIEIITSKFGFVLDLKHTQDYQLPIYPLLAEKQQEQEKTAVQLVTGLSAALIFQCPGCGEPHTGKANSFCSVCEQKIHWMNDDFFCLECGTPLESPFAECQECKGKVPWSGAASLMYYKGLGANLVKGFKFNDKTFLGRVLAERAIKLLRAHEFKTDAIAAIPMPWLRQFRRGYNQADIFARELAKKLNVPVIYPFAPTFFRKKQSRMNMKERAKSRLRSFPLKKSVNLEGLNILLVDDIFTTGATLKSAGNALKKAGAENLQIFTCAYTPRYRKKK
ncbi:MAG: YraN family protein [Lentisphaeria bacterium]|nr:YraN family protein [Lentisphaeria bacterium]